MISLGNVQRPNGRLTLTVHLPALHAAESRAVVQNAYSHKHIATISYQYTKDTFFFCHKIPHIRTFGLGQCMAEAHYTLLKAYVYTYLYVFDTYMRIGVTHLAF